MARMWIDIEDLTNEYELGFIIEENLMLIGYEYKVTNLDDIVDVIDKYQISEILYFDGNDSNYLFNRLMEVCNSNDKTKNIFFKNVGIDYKLYLEGSKLQLAKNADLARAFGINLEFNALHHPLYDIQLTYCAHHNFNIYDEEAKKNKIFDSFFVLTNKFDILWKVLKKFNVPRQFVDVEIVKPVNPQKVYFIELKERSYEDKYIVLTNSNNLSDVMSIDITKDNINEIIRLFSSNFMIFTDAQQQSNLSRHIWEVQYLNFQTRKLNANAMAIRKKLYIFMAVNISRFKLAMPGFEFKSIIEKLGNELTLTNLKNINNL